MTLPKVLAPLFLLLLSGGEAASPRPVPRPVPRPLVRLRDLPMVAQRAAGCTIACFAMVSRYQGGEVDDVRLYEAVPKAAEGASYLHVIEEGLPETGWEALVFRMEEAELRALLDCGIPVTSTWRSEGRNHAVVVSGYCVEELPDLEGRPQVREWYFIHNPKGGIEERLAVQDFRRLWEEVQRQVVLVYPLDRLAEVAGAVDLDRARADDRNWRGEEHFLLAGEERDPRRAIRRLDAARVILGDRPAVLNNMALARYNLGEREEAVRLLRAALAADPAFKPARQNLLRLGEAVDPLPGEGEEGGDGDR